MLLSGVALTTSRQHSPCHQVMQRKKPAHGPSFRLPWAGNSVCNIWTPLIAGNVAVPAARVTFERKRLFLLWIVNERTLAAVCFSSQNTTEGCFFSVVCSFFFVLLKSVMPEWCIIDLEKDRKRNAWHNQRVFDAQDWGLCYQQIYNRVKE